MTNRLDDLIADVRYIKARVDDLHTKHDDTCQRVAKTETDLRWIRGSARISITGIITLIVAIVVKLFIK
jgi:hypothetical protein